MMDLTKYDGHTPGRWYAEPAHTHGEEHLDDEDVRARVYSELTIPADVGGETSHVEVAALYKPMSEAAAWHDCPHIPVERLPEIFGREAANARLIADAPSLLSALHESRGEVERLTDLVRYQRAELHHEGLISDAEYADLVKVKGSPARLEGYDAMRAEVERLRENVESAMTHLAMLRAGAGLGPTGLRALETALDYLDAALSPSTPTEQ